MGVKDLSPTEKEVALQRMKAIADGTEIEDWEFHSRVGIDRPTLKLIIAAWPDIDDSSGGSDEFLAINNCMNEVCHGIRMSVAEWERRFTVPRTEMKRIYRKWLGGIPGGIGRCHLSDQYR